MAKSTTKGKAEKSSKVKRKNFSSFTTKEAYQQLQIKQLQFWEQQATAVPVTDFFKERMARLQRHFDLKTCEDAKKLLIDAICEEALEGLEQIKIWKGATLETPTTNGVADYLIAENKGYLETPYLCIVEAKKDDFEQGLAQCLVEMQACQWENQQVGQSIDIFGIVSNGTTWQFYKLTPQGHVSETSAYSTGDLALLLGRLRELFQLCINNLS
jgi:hypothetical protein